MFEYSNRSQRNHSLLIHLFISIVIWIPVTIFMVYTAIQVNQVSIYCWVFSLSILFALFLFHRAQTNLTFPTIEICSQHIILNTPTSKRTVYNLAYVDGAIFFWHFFYFRHNGWPVLTPLPRMPKQIREELLTVIKSS